MPSSEFRTGRFGKYILCEELGRGGNGSVRKVEVENPKYPIHGSEDYVIKIFKPRKDKEERFARFVSEIDFVNQYAEDVEGIIPIVDYCTESMDNCWYLMPQAKTYDRNKPLSDLLTDMIDLGETIAAVHDLGVMHRDIKYDNLLWYKNRIALTDFGLLYDEGTDVHITRFSEGIGAISTRPPELEPFRKTANIDYRLSDAYMFAKTVWICITGKMGCFSGEYLRDYNGVCLSSDEYGVPTFEPFHRMMEMATKTSWEKRITLNKCVEFLQEQKGIIDGFVSKDVISLYKMREKLYLTSLVDPDKKEYVESEKIFRCLGMLAGFQFAVSFLDIDNSRRYIGILSSIEDQQEERYYKFIVDEGFGLRNRMILIHVNSIVVDEDGFILNSQVIESSVVISGLVCKSISDYFRTQEAEVVMDGVFLLRFEASRFE